MSENCENAIVISDSSDNSLSDSSDDSIIDISSDSDFLNDSTESASEEIVFIDLTKDDLFEDKEHEIPNATAEELARISEQFVKDQDDGKVLNFSNVTIRKRNNKAETATRIQSDTTSEAFEKLNNSVNSTPYKAEIGPKKSFLKSLDENVALDIAHPESLKFRRNFRRSRNELVQKLICIYNARIFQNQLSNIQWTWSKWIGEWSGCCHNSQTNGENLSTIDLNEVLLTSAERVRDVLLHELCHAAVHIINKQIDREHGELWQSWGRLAKEAFPEIPPIQRYHHYKIQFKFKYKCTICWGSLLSNSKLKSNNIFCAMCHGPVELFRIKIKNGRRVTVALRKPGSFALFVKENYRLIKNPSITHVGVMQALSEKYKGLKANGL